MTFLGDVASAAARTVVNGVGTVAGALARGVGLGSTTTGQDQAGRTFVPIRPRASTPTSDLPAAERDRVREARAPVTRSHSVPADLMQERAESTDEAARQTLEEAKVELRRLQDDPTKMTRRVVFEVDFGTSIVDGQAVKHQIKLPYEVRHNGYVAPGKLKDFKVQAEQTRLILQALYSHFNEGSDEVEKHTALSILRDLKHYECIFSETPSGEPRVHIRIEDSDGRVLDHTFKSDIKVEDEGVQKTVCLETYVNHAKEIVHVAAKEVKGFGKISGFDFYKRLILAGGVIYHALSGPDPRLGPKMPAQIPQGLPTTNDDPNGLRSITEQNRRATQQQRFDTQQNQRLMEEMARSRLTEATLPRPPAFPPGHHLGQGAFQPIVDQQ